MLSLPNLEKISSAFMGCTGLETISIPASVTYLYYTFEGCTSLKEVVVAEGSNLTTIDKHSFYNCSALESINIPDSVTQVGIQAFFQCKAVYQKS